MATSVAKATTTMTSCDDGKGHQCIHGLHLLSTVVDTFLLHGNAQTQQNSTNIPIETRHYGHVHANLPRLSACSSPTDDTLNSKSHIYSSLRERARSIGKSTSALPVRVSRPKGSSFRSAVFASRPKMVTHFSPAITAGVEDFKLVRPNLVPPSPPSYLQEFSHHQKSRVLHSLGFSRQQAQGLMEKQHVNASINQGYSSNLLYAPTLNRNESKNDTKTGASAESTKVSAMALMANGERVITKKSIAELNYIKHKAVPMKEKWMARFVELAEFKKKYGHTKVPHNFPDSPKLAEWQVRHIDY